MQISKWEKIPRIIAKRSGLQTLAVDISDIVAADPPDAP